ncbi:hypothetical protein D3C79_769740 [compost metagenome]
MAQGVVLMAAMDLLQEHKVGIGGTYRLAQLGQDETPVQRGEAFVHVDRQYIETMYRGGLVDDAGGCLQCLVHNCTCGVTPGSVTKWPFRSSLSRRRRAS